MEDNFLFQLNKELEYTIKGDFEKTYTIEFKPPSMNCFNEASDFEQLFMGALVSSGNLTNRDVKQEEEDESAMEKLKKNVPTAQEIRMMITMSQEIKIKDLFGAFKRLACKSAKLDDKTPIKVSHFDKISRDDNLRMLCEYVCFFTFPSLLGGHLDKDTTKKKEEENGLDKSVT